MHYTLSAMDSTCVTKIDKSALLSLNIFFLIKSQSLILYLGLFCGHHKQHTLKICTITELNTQIVYMHLGRMIVPFMLGDFDCSID